MKISTRATYGLKAMLYLAYSYHERAIAASQIAKQEGISAPYLEQILHVLKKKQWVKSLRGPAGGYVLARKPSEIRVGPVLRDLEGKRAATAKPAARAAAARRNLPSVAAGLFWEKLQHQYTELLDNTSLKELLEDARRSEKGRTGDARLDFSI